MAKKKKPTYTLTMGNHPAQARHPLSGEPMFDSDGEPVPLFPNERSVRLDGHVIAYVSEAGNIGYRIPSSRLGEAITSEIVELVAKEFKPVKKIASPPEVD